MAKVSPIQTNFNGGEVDPCTHGRVDLDRYKVSMAKCLNYLPMIQGGLTRRTGTKFIEFTKNIKKVRLISFEYSTEQAYVLELGHKYIRFFRNGGQVVVSDSQGGFTPYELETPYESGELFELDYTQSADVLYIVHENHPPMKLMRYRDDSWELKRIDFSDGPYLPTEPDGVKVSVEKKSGVDYIYKAPRSDVKAWLKEDNGNRLVVEISNAVPYWYEGMSITIYNQSGMNSSKTNEKKYTIAKIISSTKFVLRDTLFNPPYSNTGRVCPTMEGGGTHGRLIRLERGNSRGWAKITSNSGGESQVIEGGIKGATITSPASFYRLGLWSDETGYPSSVTFYEDRLFFGGSKKAPQRVDGSCTGDYENFAPSNQDGVVASSNAVSFTLNSNSVNRIQWLRGDKDGLVIGTSGGEWLVTSASSQSALTPTSITAKNTSSFGSSKVAPLKAGRGILYVQNSKKKLREVTYSTRSDTIVSSDLSVLANHITKSGIIQLAFQREPQPIVWLALNNGELGAVTYDRDDENLRLGWHRHRLGGYSDTDKTYPLVESVACLPSRDQSYSEIWVVVNRYINGKTVKTIEVITDAFDDEDLQEDAYFLDCGLSYKSPRVKIDTIKIPIDPYLDIEIECPSHNFEVGDSIVIMNGDKFTSAIFFNVTYVHSPTIFWVKNIFKEVDAGVLFSGFCYKVVDKLTGLKHLNNEDVYIVADGGVEPPQKVINGKITLTKKSQTVHVGYNYFSDAQTLRIDAGSNDGTSMGKTRRIHQLGFMLHRSMGLLIGLDFEHLTRVIFRKTSDKLGYPTELFTGIISESLNSNYDFDNQVAWRQDLPYPSTVLAVFPQMVVQNKGGE